jgi:hypothetical protein
MRGRLGRLMPVEGATLAPLIVELGSETLLLFIAALFDNSHNERSNYHG